MVTLDKQFLTTLAHELRNPLAPISSAATIIDQCSDTNPLVKESVSTIHRQLRCVTNVINDLVDMHKIEVNELILNKQNTNLNTIVHESVEDCKSILQSRKQSIQITLPKEDVWVYGDPERLKQIISRLLHLAFKFTETEERISITIGKGQDRATVNIYHTGIGVENNLENVFSLSSTTNTVVRSVQRRSFGLTLIHKLIEAHDGAIEISSDGLEKGSEFLIFLPLGQREEKEEPKPPPPLFSSLRILIVDDHIDTAESFSSLLKMWGQCVFPCHSTMKAIKAARVFHPQVAILDIGLPGYDGYQLAEMLKVEYPDIHLIAISGYDRKIDLKKSEAMGFLKHFVKPFKTEELKVLLSKIK